jgi:hypothetical protein
VHQYTTARQKKVRSASNCLTITQSLMPMRVKPEIEIDAMVAMLAMENEGDGAVVAMVTMKNDFHTKRMQHLLRGARPHNIAIDGNGLQRMRTQTSC